MKRLVLHIGHSKCASSTLQGFLTRNAVLPSQQGGMVRYMAIDGAGQITHGDAMLRAGLVGNVFGFMLCAEHILSDSALFSSAMAQIQTISGPDDTVVLSSEAWGSDSFVTPNVQHILNAAPVPIDVFMLTRPPVEWVNAAWWQWEVWETAPSLDALKRINFLRAINNWRQIMRVDRVCVQDLSQDPIAAFLDFVGTKQIAPADDARLNVATDYDLLRHLIRNKAHYQRSSANPTIEFQLNTLFTDKRTPLPFVVSRQMAQDIIGRDQDDNLALIQLFQKSGRPLSEQVARRYLDPKAYDHLPDIVDVTDSFGADYSDAFVGKLINALRSSDQRTLVNDALFNATQAFDPQRYLALHPDVRLSGMNPYEHFIRFGFKEGRAVI